MPKKIKYFLLAVSCFVPFTVQAFDTNEFSQDFYTKIRQQVESQESLQVEKNVSVTTSLSPELVRAFMKNSLTINQQKDITTYCGDGDIRALMPSTCEENLRKMISFEFDLAKLNTEMKTKLKADETWANGTLNDSPFDLVIDLNLIDVILFGREAKIPLAEWSEVSDDSKNFNNGNGERISGTDGNGTSRPIVSQSNTANPSLNNTSQKDTGNSGSNQNQNTLQEGGAIALLNPAHYSYGDLQCLSPDSFVFMNLAPVNKSASNSSDQSTQGDSGLGVAPADNEGGKLFSDYWKGTGTGFGTTNVTAPSLCDDPLYGGYYCKTPPGGPSAIDEDKGCDPLKGVCRKCFFGELNKADSPLQFCITWEFKNSQHSLFSSIWVEDSIRGYIESMLEEYRNLNAAAPLTPKAQQNQGGFSTHPYDLSRGVGKMLYTESKIPDQWLHEAKQVGFSQSEIAERSNRLQIATQQAIANELSIRTTSLQGSVQTQNERDVAEKQRLVETYKTINADFSREALNTYYKNILFNLENFRNIFENRVEKQINVFPFTEVQNAGTKVCK